MFQFETARPRRRPTHISAAPPQPKLKVTHRALLAWGEHCIECAAPACFASCDLYDATPAGKCRRFEGGIISNASAGTADGPAAEVRFRRWGKLEAQGNSALMATAQVRLIERLLVAATPFVSVVGRGITKLTGQTRWSTAMEALHKNINDRLQAGRRAEPAPNAFVAEMINPSERPVRLLLTASVDKLRMQRNLPADQLPKPMTAAIEATPGFSQHVMPLDKMREILGAGLPFNLALAPADGGDEHLIFRRLDLVALEAETTPAEIAAAAHAPTKAAKLVVFDLDNTLWDGVLLEGDVALRPGVFDLFRTLDERGVLISIASKNAHDDGMAKLKEFGLDEFVLHQRISWAPKSQGVAQIIKAIDIGADTVLFVDDNPFERAEVATAVSGIEVLPDTAIPSLADHPRLQGSVTAESKNRRHMYREAIVREQAAEGYGDDYLAFLRDCEIHLQIRRDTLEDLSRIVELVQRTNQLNFSGRKYDRDEISAILADPAVDRHVVICRDKFGGYGAVGFCLSHREGDATGEVVVVDDFMLSCRVQGKFIEQALFWRLTEGSSQKQAQAIIVDFKRTERNGAAQMVLDKLGFISGPDGRLRREIRSGDLAVDFLTIEA